jgi:hypothetical protein
MITRSGKERKRIKTRKKRIKRKFKNTNKAILKQINQSRKKSSHWKRLKLRRRSNKCSI